MSFLTKEVKEEIPDDKKNKWTREQEELLANWADKAICYRWLHDNSEKKFYKKNMWIAIPVITLSTIAGVANFGTEGIFPENVKEYSNIIIGSISVLTSLWSTYGNFLGYAQKMESHRLSMIAWSKFNRNISVELALSPEERQNPIDFINICRAELDRLVEASPSIPDDIINKFEVEFEGIDITKPEVCHNLEKTKIYLAQDLKEIVEKETASRLDYLSQKGLLTSDEKAGNLINKFARIGSLKRKIEKDTNSMNKAMEEYKKEPKKVVVDVVNSSGIRIPESMANIPVSTMMERVMETVPDNSSNSGSSGSEDKPINSLDELKIDIGKISSGSVSPIPVSRTPGINRTPEITAEITKKAGEVAQKTTNKFLESLFNADMKSVEKESIDKKN